MGDPSWEALRWGGVMAFFLTAFLRGWIVTGPLHRRALDRNDALSEIARRQSVSLDRLTRYLGKV